MVKNAMSEPVERDFVEVVVPPSSVTAYLRSTAASFGHIRGKEGNVRSLMRALGRGEYRLVKQTASTKTIDIFVKLNDWILRQTAFTVRVEDRGNITNYDVSYAKVSIDPNGKYLLLAYTHKSNPAEIPQLKHNHEIELDKIVDAGEIHRPWCSSPPTIQVKFWISSDLHPSYETRPEDISMVIGTQHDRAGNVVIREVMTTHMLLSELLSYGNNCYSISPSIVRRRLLVEVEKILSDRSSSAK
jgi:hypothetical protein